MLFISKICLSIFHLSIFHGLLIMIGTVLKNVLFHIMGKFLLTAMFGIENYKTGLKKYHLRFHKMFNCLNFSLHTSVFSIFSFFNTLYSTIINICIRASSIYNIFDVLNIRGLLQVYLLSLSLNSWMFSSVS